MQTVPVDLHPGKGSTYRVNRRHFLLGSLAALTPSPTRTVVVMLDGFGLEYYTASEMPTLKRWAAQGLFAKVQSQLPSVTNTNNAGICCGVPASKHGISGNSYLNLDTGREDFMQEASLLRAPTLFQKAPTQKSALFTSKRKTASLLNAGASLVIAAESPTPALIQRYGPAPDIYSAEINHWLFDAVIDHLAHRPDLTLFYIHTTDYPMHMHPPNSPESLAHLKILDAKLAAAAHVAPDAAFYLTADHGMNFKTRAWDLDKACAHRDAPIKLSISADRDKYPKQHLGLGGLAYVYLNHLSDESRVAAVIEKLPGVERVLPRTEAARLFDLPPDRIGDLVITADPATVFGTRDSETETLASTYRSHGSRYETHVPLIIYNNEKGHHPAMAYQRNLDLTFGLF